MNNIEGYANSGENLRERLKLLDKTTKFDKSQQQAKEEATKNKEKENMGNDIKTIFEDRGKKQDRGKIRELQQNKQLNTIKDILKLVTKDPIIHTKSKHLKEIDKDLFCKIFVETRKKIIKKHTKIENNKQRNIEKKDIIDFYNQIKNNKITVSTESNEKGSQYTLTLENLKYAQIHNQKLTIFGDIPKNIKQTLRTNPSNLYKYLPKLDDVEAINYQNELPKNFRERETAIQSGSSELKQIIKKNANIIAPIIGRNVEDINDENMFDLRVLLLTDKKKLKEISRQINFNEEMQKVRGIKLETQNDTQNFITTLNQRYHIKDKLQSIKDSTGIGSTLLYYKKNKNNPNTKDFCKEFEETIYPQLENNFKEIIKGYQFKEVTIRNIDDFINYIDHPNIRDNKNNKKQCSNILFDLGVSLNDKNKTEALKKNKLTPESIKRGEELVNVFESTSKEPKTPQEKKTMEQVLQGEYFQEQLGNKMQQLMGNPKLSNFFAKHPNLRSFTLEDLAKFDGRDPAQKLLIQLVANTFVSKKALDSYQHNLIDTNKLDDVNAITETVDQVFEEALNDESLFKDFENESINLEDEKEYQGVIDITGDKTINYGELLDEFDKKHQNLSKPIKEYTEDHDPTSDREALWEDHAKESLITKLNKLSKKYQEKLHIDLGLNTILKREDINLNEKNTTTLPFDRSEVERRLHGNRLKMSDHLKQKIENKIKKLIGKEQEKKKNYIENSDSSLNKLIITNRVQTTINMLQSYPFTKGLNLNVDDPQSILIDKDLNITLQGNYEGKPCQLCINANGEVKTTVYYEYSHTDEQITFNNSPNFTLFTLPSLKEQREIGLQTLKEKNAREEVSQQFKEQIKVNPKGIDNFPREKEKGLCLLKIKELTRGTEIMTNKATPQKYQFFKEMEESIKNAEDANRIKRILSRFEKAIHQMHNGATFIEENSQIFHTLFNKTTLEKQKNNANNENKFDENSYVILLRHFMREEGGTKTLRIDDMVAFIKAFSEGGDTAIQKQEAKILGQATGEQDSQYRAYQNTKLAELLKKPPEQKETKGPKG